MNETTIASVAGIVVSLVFSYVPGVKGWFDALTADYKRLVMLGALVVAVGVLFGASCLGYATDPACTVEGAKALLPLFIAAVIANQGTFLLTPSKS
jgi:hypothetical protein